MLLFPYHCLRRRSAIRHERRQHTNMYHTQKTQIKRKTYGKCLCSFLNSSKDKRREKKIVPSKKKKEEMKYENVKFLACLLYWGLCSVWSCTIGRLNLNMNMHGLINVDILQKFRRNTFDIWMLKLNIANKHFYECPHTRFILFLSFSKSSSILLFRSRLF